MTRRLALLLDAGSFVLHGDDDNGEIIGGIATIQNRKVCIIAINPESSVTVDPFEFLQQELALLDLAENRKIPIILLADRPQRVAMETTAIPLTLYRTFIDPRGVGLVFARFARLSGVIPTIAVVFSPIATTLTYPVAECDTVIMVDGAGMSLARPDMVRLMTGDTSPYEDYGGARMHTEISGTCDKLVFSEREAMDWVRNYLALFPGTFTERPPVILRDDTEPATFPEKNIVPPDPDQAFDMHQLLGSFIDSGSFLEHREGYAREIITAFTRVGGMPVGIIANNAGERGGILFPETCRKIAAFASLCDAFNIPIVFLADVPGFMVGKVAEQGGIIRYGALVFSTIANLCVPHLCIVVRKAYTAGLYAMGGPGFAPERFLALPHACIAIYGRKAIQRLGRKNNLSAKDQSDMADRMQENCDVRRYAESGYLDNVIEEKDLRKEIRLFLEASYAKPLVRTAPRRILDL
jgi:methylmalonyl-CoA decarboxylase subunit alpha